MSGTPRDCEHGHLARACELCEHAAEVERLTAERDRLQAGLVGILVEADEGAGDHTVAGECCNVIVHNVRALLDD